MGTQRDALEDEAPDVSSLIKAYVSKAMVVRRGIDRTFWLLATSDAISTAPL